MKKRLFSIKLVNHRYYLFIGTHKERITNQDNQKNTQKNKLKKIKKIAE